MELSDTIIPKNSGMTFLHGELFSDPCTIIEQSQESAYRSVNETLVKRNWLLGMRIQRIHFYQAWSNIFHAVSGKFENAIDSIKPDSPIKFENLNNPIVAEFLGFKNDKKEFFRLQNE